MKSALRLILLPLAMLPLSVLYIFADILYLLIYHLVRYRRKIVRANLAACFPTKTQAERKAIERQFYRNFADYIVETIKLLHISDAEMRRRMVFENIEVMDRLAADGKSTLVYFAHVGNWEWATAVTLYTKLKPSPSMRYAQVYRPLKNKAIDRLMLSLRSRFGTVSLPKATVLRNLIEWKRAGALSATGFMSDQKPSHGDTPENLMFLGRPTAFISGSERLAAKLSMAAIYWDMEKISRGHYRITCRTISENVADDQPGTVTRRYASMLQQTIERNPAIWLWTHNRWKNQGR